jgi:hypothetical protein
VSKGDARSETAIIDVPLTSGLAQKNDPRLLPLGQSATATNIVLAKEGSMQKTPGLSTLSVTDPTIGIAANSIARLATLDYGLCAVSTDSAIGIEGVWSRDEAANALFLNDRISEVYIPPVFGALGQSTQPIEIDTCVCQVGATPYELHVGLWQVGNLTQVFYSVTEATPSADASSTQRSFIVPNSPVAALNSLLHVYSAPKVVLRGTTAVLTAQDVQGNTIYATQLDMTQPWAGWSNAVPLVTNAASSLGTFGHNPGGVYDTCAVDDDHGAALLLAYEKSVGGTQSIAVCAFNAGLGLVSSGTLPDSAWTTAAVDLSAIAIRASLAEGAAWVAYAYDAGAGDTTPQAVVNAGALVYPGLGSVLSTPISSGDMTNGFNGYPAPQVIDIKKAGTVSGFVTQQVVWSPPPLPVSGSALVPGPPVLVGASSYNTGSATPSPCCAIYQAAIHQNSGTTTLHANQPRWTNNVVLGSRMCVVENAQSFSHAYLVGWIPSSNEIPGATSLQDVSVFTPGSGYSVNGVIYAPVVTVTGGGGSGAQVAVTIDPTTVPAGQITGVQIISGGSGYTSLPTINLTFGSGVVFNTPIQDPPGGPGPIVAVGVTSGGSGYSTVPQSVPVLIADSSGAGSGFQGWAIVDSSGAITGVQVVSRGDNYGAGTVLASVQTPGTGGAIAATIPTVTAQNIQGTFFLFCMDTFQDAESANSGQPLSATSVNVPLRMCGLWKPRLGKGNTFAQNHVLPHLVPNPSASPTGALIQTDLPIDVNANVSVSTICSADFGNEYCYQPGELGGLVGFAGGLPTLYDGARTADFAFPYYPENIVPNPVQLLDAPIPPGTYQYISIYSRRDASGARHVSGRSVPATAVLAPAPSDVNNFEVKLQIPCMGFSTAQRGVPLEDGVVGLSSPVSEFIEVYRTINGGTTFLDIATPPTTLNTNNVPNLNSIVFPYIVVVDTTTDADLVNNEELYGDGLDSSQPNANIDNLCPPPLQGLITHKNRWFGFDGNQVWYTKAFTDGEGPGWNELSAFSVDDGPGPITALASMDERLIIFKRDRLFYVSGDGPADNGTQNDLQPPQRIQSSVGCINWRSVVGSPVGVWFESDDGLYQLTRKLEVQPAGTFVEDTLGAYTDMTSATLDMRNGLVIFTANDPSKNRFEVTTGTLINYSWVLDCWTTQVINPPTGSPPALNGSVLSGPNLALTLSGPLGLARQTTGDGPGSYMVGASAGHADGTYQSMVWQSPWIKGPTAQGWMRAVMIDLLWESLDAHKLLVTAAYDYAEAPTDSWFVTATAQANVTTPLIQWSFQPSNAQVESMQITVTDVADSVVEPTSGQGPLLIACTVEVRDLGGTVRKNVQQRGSA